jgi:ATP-binding cassette subfamily B protein
MHSAKKLLPYLKPYLLWVIIAPFLMMLEVFMDLLQPRMVQRVIDQGVAQSDANLVIQTGLLMLVIAIVGAFGGMANGYFAEKVSQGFGADMREALFRKVQSFSFGNLDQFGTGQLITRLTNDVNQVQEAIVMILRMMVRAPFLLIGSIIMAILTSPELLFILLILLPVELVVVLVIIQKATPLFTQVQDRLDKLNEVMQENLAGVRVVKAFGRAPYEEARFGAANTNLTNKSIQAGRTVAFLPSFMMMTINLGVIGVLWFGGANVTSGNMEIGQLIAFVNYLFITLFSLMMVSQMVILVARAEASARRIDEVISTVPDVQNRPQTLQETNLQGQVAFEHVSFRYNGDESEPVLMDVSFTAEPGEVVALLGTTGSGKSSLVHLIPRYYDVSAGRVLVDGIDVRDLNIAALRRKVGVALQESVLFSGTIRDNIRYGNPEASDEEVVTAAKAAQAHDFIQSFPEGYDTLIGQRGVNLSGGQKQRIAIARALLLKPAVLILDDSTSAVDVETEARIQEALQEIMRQHTSFIIAQRISTVLAADKILVLDGGKIAAQGTHLDLMETSPIYRDIYSSQLGNGGAVYA